MVITKKLTNAKCSRNATIRFSKTSRNTTQGCKIRLRNSTLINLMSKSTFTPRRSLITRKRNLSSKQKTASTKGSKKSGSNQFKTIPKRKRARLILSAASNIQNFSTIISRATSLKSSSTTWRLTG